MTEWHARYGGRGVMIYWHVEKQATCNSPAIFACEEDVGPSEWRDMRHEVLGAIESSYSPLRDSDAVLFGVPIDYDCGEQVQTGDAKVLAFRGAVTDFALPPDPKCALQCMVPSPTSTPVR